MREFKVFIKKELEVQLSNKKLEVEQLELRKLQIEEDMKNITKNIKKAKMEKSVIKDKLNNLDMKEE